MDFPFAVLQNLDFSTMPLILHHAFQTWNNVIESWLYLVKAIGSEGSIGQFGAF